MKWIPQSFRSAGGLAYRQARRLVISLIGGTLLLIGAALLLTPGPGIVVIGLGLGVLAVEFTWARRWLNRLKTEAQTVGQRMGKRRYSTLEPVQSEQKKGRP